MKILELTSRYPPAIGGVERHVSEVASHLAARGHEVTVWTSDLLSTASLRRVAREPDNEAGVSVERMRGFAPPVLDTVNEVLIPKLTMRLFSESTRFDVVHAHGFRYFPTYGCIAPRLFSRFPLVVSTHSGPDLGVAAATYDLFFRTLFWRLVDRLICQTQHEAEIFRRNGLPGPTHVITPGVGSMFFKDPYHEGDSPVTKIREGLWREGGGHQGSGREKV